MRKLRLRITAVLLILVLVQGAGLRFIVHNVLHKTAVTSAATDHTKSNVQAFCDCLDEALMPSTQTPAFELIVPQQQVVVIQNNFNIFLSSTTKIFHSLRAPPATIV